MQPPPTKFGPYPVHSLLGSGGTGAVYLAWHPTQQCELAIKSLSQQGVASPTARARFQREIRALAQLRHPGLLQILDAGEEEGVPWFATRRVLGGPLDARLETRGPLSLEETLELGVQLARALGCAHQAGILHRDLKPENVLCAGEGGRYVLTDFGLAKDLLNDESVRLSNSGAIQGTPGYWAPEQAAGTGHRATVATDVYGLGAVLYAALTGRSPIEGDSLMALVMATVESAPPPPSERGDSVPALDALVLRCLNKSPQDRPSTMAEVEAELTRLQLAGRGELEREAGQTRRLRGVYLGLALALSLALGLGLGAWALARTFSRAPTPASTATASPRPLTGPELSQAAEAAFTRGDLTGGLELLRSAAEAGHPESMTALGLRRRAGEGLEADPRGATRWFQQAAGAGEPRGMLEFGRALAKGQGIDADEVEAAEWYRRAAEAGIPEAKYLLGESLVSDEDAPEEHAALGRDWIRQAAQGGHPPAMVKVGSYLALTPGGEEGLRSAATWYRKAAEQGDAEGMRCLADSLTKAWGVERDLEEAARWYRRSAEVGSLGGLHGHAEALLRGRGVTRDAALGIRLLTRAADRGYGPALLSLGQAHLTGVGVTKSRDKSKEWFQRAAEAGHAPAWRWLAKLEGPESPKYASLLRRAAREGDGPSMVVLGQWALARGEKAEALEWARAGVAQGDPDAMVFMGYLAGPTESARWLGRAAALGHLTAMVNLGSLYEKGAPKRKEEAFRWYLRAAKGGAPIGMLLVSEAYATASHGVSLDQAEAERWARLAVQAGVDGEEVRGLGAMFYGRQEYASAARLYRIAAEHGSTVGMVCLADCLRRGLGTPKNHTEARALLLKASAGGDAAVMYLAAQMLLKGEGGPKDPAQGAKLLNLSADSGDDRAMYAFAVCLERGLGVAKDRAKALDYYRRAQLNAKSDLVKENAAKGIARLGR